MSRGVFFSASFGLFFLLGGCADPGTGGLESAPGKVQVATSFYPLAHFARQVGGDFAEVTDISGGNDPHLFDPTPGDIIRLQNADLVILQGAGLEPWAEDLRARWRKEGTKELVIVQDLSLLEAGAKRESEVYDGHNEEMHEHDDHHDERLEHAEDEKHSHEHGGSDPHTWLDPLLAVRSVELIAAALIEIDPQNAAEYGNNAEMYIAELRLLHEEIDSGLADCEKDKIITAHEAFTYLAARYGFETVSIAGLSSGDTPSARRLAELKQLATEQGIGHVFAERNTASAIAEVLASEADLQVLVLDPLETEPGTGGYIDVMRDNLINLQTALQCRKQR